LIELIADFAPDQFRIIGQGIERKGGEESLQDFKRAVGAAQHDPFEPIAIEISAGRAEYVRAQQDVADRAAPLRAELADRCDLLLSTANRDSGSVRGT